MKKKRKRNTKSREEKESETSRDEYKQKYSRTYDEIYQCHRLESTWSSTTPPLGFLPWAVHSMLQATKQLNRPHSLIAMTSVYSRVLTNKQKIKVREGEKREQEKED